MQHWTAKEWTGQRGRCLSRIEPTVRAHLDRASRHEKHPVIDFLFQYYSFRPSQLLSWSPGLDVCLEAVEGEPMPDWMEDAEGNWIVSADTFPEKRRSGLQWVLELLEAMDSRPPRFGCFGLHEWAMVYRASPKAIRHAGLPLRCSEEAIAQQVESGRLKCTHYDAFRFFTPPARPLNPEPPEHGRRMEQEQGGCIHANMDLYKWAYKYYPWISSERIVEAFLLALEARWIDMRASPYDVSGFKVAPILIESESGRKEYQTLQQELAEKAIPIRRALIEDLTGLLNTHVERPAIEHFFLTKD